MMSPRKRMLTALRRQEPDKVPWCIPGLAPELQKIFHEMENTSLSLMEYYDYEHRNVSIRPSRKKRDWSRYYKELSPSAQIDEWGVARVPSLSRGSYHFTRILHPLQNASSLKEIEEYPFPDVEEEYRWEGISDEIKEIQGRGYAAMSGAGSLFEAICALRGPENVLMDFAAGNEMIKALIDRVAETVRYRARRLALAGIDILVFGDDIGMQDRMIMSPAMWREWIKPRFAQAIQVAKEGKPDILIFYHSDGYIEPVIPELIEIGVDILNPVQPECMDPEEIKRKYGDKLSFWGTVGTQTTMPFGTPEKIKAVVKRRIEIVGKGGGLVIAPTHTLEPEVLWENVIAFIEAVRDFGVYRRK